MVDILYIHKNKIKGIKSKKKYLYLVNHICYIRFCCLCNYKNEKKKTVRTVKVKFLYTQNKKIKRLKSREDTFI